MGLCRTAISYTLYKDFEVGNPRNPVFTGNGGGIPSDGDTASGDEEIRGGLRGPGGAEAHPDRRCDGDQGKGEDPGVNHSEILSDKGSASSGGNGGDGVDNDPHGREVGRRFVTPTPADCPTRESSFRARLGDASPHWVDGCRFQEQCGHFPSRSCPDLTSATSASSSTGRRT